MLIRKSILPRTPTDIASSLFLLLCIPLIYLFELSVVLPVFYDSNTLMFYFHAIMGTFVLINIITNQFALILCDTSIKGKQLTPPSGNEAHLKLWKMCAVCETLTPPRSWHCNICKTCILKRDHHCVFTGCCIGHQNHRYFMMLIFYLCVGTAYASVFNNYFIWVVHADRFLELYTILKIAFPFVMIAFEPSVNQLYLTGYLINMIGMLFTGFLLAYHVQNLRTGSLVHDRSSPALYNLGFRRNIEMVFGKRWYLTWLSPFVNSELPHNGIHWETVLEQSIKNRQNTLYHPKKVT